MVGPARQGFESNAPGAGEQVQHFLSRQVSQDLEQGFAHAAGRGPDARTFRSFQLSSLRGARDDLERHGKPLRDLKPYFIFKSRRKSGLRPMFKPSIRMKNTMYKAKRQSPTMPRIKPVLAMPWFEGGDRPSRMAFSSNQPNKIAAAPNGTLKK